MIVARRVAKVWRRAPPAKRWLYLSASLFICFLVGMIYTSETYDDDWRFLMGYLGFGWCAPHQPRQLNNRYTFEGSDGPDVRWPNDEEFWRHFPCDRSEYRVVMPTGWNATEAHGRNLAIAAADPAEQCTPTIATAWFDIDRGNWKYFRRSPEVYWDSMVEVLSLKNRLIVFTYPEFVDKVVEQRKRHGLMHRTMVVAMSLKCMPIAHYIEPVSELMCRPEYLAQARSPEVPERQHPWYNLVMYAKAYFFRAAAHVPALASDYYIWLDLGCHVPMCGPQIVHQCIVPAAGARQDRLRMGQTEVISDRVMSLDPSSYVKEKHVRIIGTIFGIGASKVTDIFNHFVDTLNWMLAQGAVDQDQSIFAYMFFKRPDTFDLYYVHGEWSRSVTNF